MNVRSSIRGPDEKDRFEHYNSNSGPSSRQSNSVSVEKAFNLGYGDSWRVFYLELRKLNHLDTEAPSRIYGIDYCHSIVLRSFASLLKGLERHSRRSGVR